MEKDNKKKKKIIGISLGVVGALLLLFSGTYAYWQLTKEQSSANEIVAACLDFELSDVTEAISLERAYPISEAESEELTGYTFKVKNNCNDSIDYTIGLNSITNSSENYLANTSLRVKLDTNTSTLYSSLNDIEHIENVRYSKELGTSTILGNSENTHLLKVWVDKNAPVTEQGKSFTGKIIITGSVGNTSSGEQIADSCFEIGNDGTILSYDYSCGTDIVVPAEINGIQVKKIASFAFKANMYSGYYYDENDNLVGGLVITDKEHESEIEKKLLMMYFGFEDESEVQGHTLSEVAQVYETLEDMLVHFEGKDYDISGAYFNPVTGEITNFTADKDLTTIPHSVTTLDLSDAIYLEEIEYNAFSGFFGYAEVGECGSQTEGTCNLGTLEEVIFPENGTLTYISHVAFYGNRLTDLKIPDGVVTIDQAAFGCNQIENLTLPNTLIYVGYSAFSFNKLTKVVIPGSVTEIYWSSFDFNPLTEVIIKRANADGMNIDSGAFPEGITPIFDPNYTE